MENFEKEFAKIEAEYYAGGNDTLSVALANRNNTVVIFGAGAVGHLIAKTVAAAEAKLAAFCDSHKSGLDENYQIPIISPAQLKVDYQSAIVIIASDYKHNEEMYQQMLGLGFQSTRLFRIYSGYELCNLDTLKTHYSGYEWAYNFFKDEISRKIILDRLRNYLFYSEMEHSPCEYQYFESNVISLSDNEVFVDGGCYTGDSALEFIKLKNGKFAYIYGFEPDKANYEKARNEFAAKSNIEIINKGLWSKECVLLFDSGKSGSSAIYDNGNTSVSVTSLDVFFDENRKFLPTFIKMDIEGAEKEALLGAKTVISKTHPKLAICVYHKPEDIYEIPRLINEMGEYKFTLRHYSRGFVETVLYAV
jgi:FkbM family methyltransferase